MPLDSASTVQVKGLSYLALGWPIPIDQILTEAQSMSRSMCSMTYVRYQTSKGIQQMLLGADGKAQELPP